MDRLIFHVDVNSAFLSWTAAHQVLVLGQDRDLRRIPSVIAGDREDRRAVVLAKSIPAGRCGVHTGEALFQAQRKCPGLVVEKPDYPLYVSASRAFISLLRRYAPAVEQYSIDEAFLDMTGVAEAEGDPAGYAGRLRDRVWEELGFTVNVGVSVNRLLAKMAGDFSKPNQVHTLFPEEIPEKLWPLPVRRLFLIGPATERKLHYYGIRTVGDLARTDREFLRRQLHRQGEVLWNYAHGRSGSDVTEVPALNKGYGNSITTPFDVTDLATARRVLLSLCETVAARMRSDGQTGSLVTVQIRDRDFTDRSHQLALASFTDVTEEIWQGACRALEELWDGERPLRQLGVQVSRLAQGGPRQYNVFDGRRYDRLARLDTAVDAIRAKYGEKAILRACFARSPIPPMSGGLHPERRTGVTRPLPPG